MWQNCQRGKAKRSKSEDPRRIANMKHGRSNDEGPRRNMMEHAGMSVVIIFLLLRYEDEYEYSYAIDQLCLG